MATNDCNGVIATKKIYNISQIKRFVHKIFVIFFETVKTIYIISSKFSKFTKRLNIF